MSMINNESNNSLTKKIEENNRYKKKFTIALATLSTVLLVSAGATAVSIHNAVKAKESPFTHAALVFPMMLTTSSGILTYWGVELQYLIKEGKELKLKQKTK